MLVGTVGRRVGTAFRPWTAITFMASGSCARRRGRRSRRTKSAAITLGASMSLREFSYVKGKSRKFWNIELSEHAVSVHFGRVGASGRQQTKRFSSPHQAKVAYEKIIAEKLARGYRELPAKLKKTPARSLARTRYRVG